MKLLQTELIMGLGWKWRDGSRCCIFTELPCKLQHSDSLTGGNMYRSWSETLRSLPLRDTRRERIPMRCDLNCGDRGANVGCGNRIARHMEPSKLRLDDTGCGTHNTHLATKKQFRIFNSMLSGVTGFSLLLQFGGSSCAFRLCIQLCLLACARPRLNTEPPLADHPWMIQRSLIFDTLLEKTTKGIQQRLQLEYYFRGSLETEHIDVFLFVPEDKVDLALEEWSIGAAWALFPSGIPTLSPNRWVTNLTPLTQQTILDAVNMIKNKALKMYSKDFKGNGQNNGRAGNCQSH